MPIIIIFEITQFYIGMIKGLKIFESNEEEETG
jgi:hypothetical protein